MRKFLIGLVLIFLIGSSFSLIPSAMGYKLSEQEFFHYLQENSKRVVDNSDESDVDDYLSRPTFGLSNENNNKIVDYGFKINEEKFFLSDNFHTPFLEQSIEIGENNSFEATVYAQKGLKVQEFLFGIPEVGEAHKAELGIEIWYNYAGKIIDVRAIQKTNVIDEDNIFAVYEKTKCRSFSDEKKCDSTKIQVVFLEPLKYKIMAIKAIDFMGRYQITYLNEGIDVSGQSLNPAETVFIASPTKNDGPIKLTQSEKYSVLWNAEDGRIFERNSFDSFWQINHSFEKFQDSGEPLNRKHSEFGNLIENEKLKAIEVFNATNFVSELPDTFSYTFPDSKQRIDNKIKLEMLEQEKIAQKILEDSQIQSRFSEINSGLWVKWYNEKLFS